MAIELKDNHDGTFSAPGARIIDRAGDRRLPIGDDGFVRAMARSVLVDKTMLVADVLNANSTVTLFCRPRRFGKTLNMTMLKAYLEQTPDGSDLSPLFKGTDVWEAEGGRYREHQGGYPVIYISFRTAKGGAWTQTLGAIRELVSAEFGRLAPFFADGGLTAEDDEKYRRIMAGRSSEGELAGSLMFLARCLKARLGKRVVILVDEYDAPVMAGYSAPAGGYYREVVSFLKQWLTSPLKDGGEVLAFACLTGVQRISKESIFSDLNNIVVSTALDTRFEERYGFTDAEVEALATYLGHGNCMPEARAWYDGYRFGRVDVYNPWSVLNYFDRDCEPGAYWGNTSGNAVVGELVRNADEATLADVYKLLEPRRTVWRPLDMRAVFSDGTGSDVDLWSMLYLAGYLTTSDTAAPEDVDVPRRLRIPNREIATLYRSEIVARFRSQAGGFDRLNALHEALAAGDENAVSAELGRIARDSVSSFDLTSENACHMLLLGLLFGARGYADPVSNREHGLGRPDIQMIPAKTLFFEGRRPLMTIELKFARDIDDESLSNLAEEGLTQIAEKRYDAEPSALAHGRVRWGIAFSGKRVVAKAQMLE